jgi:hypothetical protein
VVDYCEVGLHHLKCSCKVKNAEFNISFCKVLNYKFMLLSESQFCCTRQLFECFSSEAVVVDKRMHNSKCLRRRKDSGPTCMDYQESVG